MNFQHMAPLWNRPSDEKNSKKSENLCSKVFEHADFTTQLFTSFSSFFNGVITLLTNIGKTVVALNLR